MFKEKTNKSVRLSYGIILSVLTVAVAVLFVWQVLSIFNSSNAPVLERKPFSREIVLTALSKIDLFFWLWVGAIVVGFVLWEVFPVKEANRKICPDLQYARLMGKFPTSAPVGLEGEYTKVIKERKLIFALKCSAWALFGIACIVGIVYLCIPSNFNNKNVTLEVLDFVKCVFPCIFAGLLLICGAGIYEKYAVKNILPSVKNITKGVKGASQPLTLCEKIEAVFDNKYVLLGIRIALGVIAVALIIWGTLNGNARSIMIKAINICTECIGLG